MMERFIRAGTVAAILGGLLLAVGSFLRLLPPHYEQFSDEAVTGSFLVSSALRFVGAILMTWGLVGIYSRQADRAGRLGLVAIVACLANMALQGGWIFADVFVAPTFADAAPQILNADSDGRLGVAGMAAWLANTSFVLLGVASLRARVLPKICGIALLVAGAVTLVPLPVDGPAYEVIIGIAFAVAGVRAFGVSAPVPLATAQPAA
jgi:cytochrome c oxidase assembly factor CtaG